MTPCKTKLVHCNNITFVYDYTGTKNISTFTFENDEEQLKRLILTNFVDYYVIDEIVLEIHEKGLPYLQERIREFVKKFERKSNSKYIAVLDLSKNKYNIKLLIKGDTLLTEQELSEIWGNKITIECHPYDEILDQYATSLRSTANVPTKRLFTSEKLKKPKVLHNKLANNFIEVNELLDSDEYNNYEIMDKEYGKVIVNEYVNIP